MRWTAQGTDDNKGQKVRTGTTLRVGFDAETTVRLEECWDTWSWGNAVWGETGWAYDTKSVKPMAAQQCAYLRSVASRSLPALLRGAMGADALVVSVPAPKGADGALEHLAVWTDGRLSVLGVARDTGRIMMLRFRDRGPNLTIGEVEHRFGDYRTVAGVLVPFMIERRFNGQPWKGGDIVYAEIVANEPVEVDDLARAK